jgi:hypothetical protein
VVFNASLGDAASTHSRWLEEAPAAASSARLSWPRARPRPATRIVPAPPTTTRANVRHGCDIRCEPARAESQRAGGGRRAPFCTLSVRPAAR